MLTYNEVKAAADLETMRTTPEGFGYRGLAAMPHLAVFRPRCPACRGVLTESPWLDGLRLMWCRQCGHKYRECA